MDFHLFLREIPIFHKTGFSAKIKINRDRTLVNSIDRRKYAYKCAYKCAHRYLANADYSTKKDTN